MHIKCLQCVLPLVIFLQAFHSLLLQPYNISTKEWTKKPNHKGWITNRIYVYLTFSPTPPPKKRKRKKERKERVEEVCSNWATTAQERGGLYKSQVLFLALEDSHVQSVQWKWKSLEKGISHEVQVQLSAWDLKALTKPNITWASTKLKLMLLTWVSQDIADHLRFAFNFKYILDPYCPFELKLLDSSCLTV